MRGQLNLDAKSPAMPKTKINMRPKDGRIPLLFGHRSRHNLRVPMPFHHLKTRPTRRVIERVRELAKPAADRRHDTPLQDLTPLHKPAPAHRSPQVLPQAKDRPGRHAYPIEQTRRHTKILELPRPHAPP